MQDRNLSFQYGIFLCLMRVPTMLVNDLWWTHVFDRSSSQPRKATPRDVEFLETRSREGTMVVFVRPAANFDIQQAILSS